MAQRIEFALDLPPGRWQVIWFGSVETTPISASAFVINTFFRRYPSTGAPASLELRKVSLAHMHLLPMGMVLGGAEGELEAEDALTSREKLCILAVDFSAHNTELVARSDLPFAVRTSAWPNRAQYEGFFIRARASGECSEVFIPCACLFQFYWGTSSALADAVLAGGLEQPEKNLFRPHGTWIEPDGTYFLELRKQWADEEAAYIATLLRDPAALGAGRHTYRSIIAQMQEGTPNGPFRFEVWPPFQRICSLYVRASQPQDGRMAGPIPYLVTRILSGDLAPNWTKLIFTRENDASGRAAGIDTPAAPASPEHHAGAAGAPLIVPSSAVTVSEAPSGYSRSGMSIKALYPIGLRFPDVGSLDVQKVPKSATAPASAQVGVRPWPRRSPGPWSAISGPTTAGTRTLRAKLGVDRRASSPAPGSDTPAQDYIDQQLDQVGWLLSRMPNAAEFQGRQHHLTVEFWDPYSDDIPSSRAPLFFTMPRAIDGRRLTWLFRDPDKKRTKRGLCARIHLSDGTFTVAERFLVDLERRTPASRGGALSTSPINSSMLAIWFHTLSGESDAKAVIRDVLAAVAVRGNPAITTRPRQGVCMATVRHLDSGVEPKYLVERVLASQDRLTDKESPMSADSL